MKKRMLAVAILLVLSMGIMGCAKTECEFCGEMKRCKTYQNMLLGEVEVCDDCMEEINSWN